MDKTYTFCCKRCGDIFESTGEPDFCESCRKIVYSAQKKRVYAVKKQCEVCGAEFITMGNAKRVCPECRAFAQNHRAKHTPEKPKPKRTQNDIVNAVKQAQEMGLTYGEYMAKYGGNV